MGCRRNIKLEYRKIDNDNDVQFPIYFYTHWGAQTLAKELQNALIRGKERWNDEPYLSRIIFSEMIKDDVLELTGYGIACYEMDPEFSTINVNLEHQTVNSIPFEKFIKMDIEDFWPEDTNLT